MEKGRIVHTIISMEKRMNNMDEGHRPKVKQVHVSVNICQHDISLVPPSCPPPHPFSTSLQISYALAQMNGWLTECIAELVYMGLVMV